MQVFLLWAGISHRSAGQSEIPFAFCMVLYCQGPFIPMTKALLSALHCMASGPVHPHDPAPHQGRQGDPL